MRTIKGTKVAKTDVFKVGEDQWTWQFTDDTGLPHVDSDVYDSREQAERALDAAYDRPLSRAPTLMKLIREGGYSQRGAARELEISERMMRYYCSGEMPVPRVVLLALEHLVECPRRAGESTR